MYNGNGRPLNKKKQVQVMIALTILAWATQTLRHQWGFGADIQLIAPDAKPIDGATKTAAPEDGDETGAPREAFVPGEARFASGATLEMRSDATIVGAEIKLKQICRWSNEDKAVFAPVADFVVARIQPRSPFRKVTIAELKSTLTDAGINLATIDVVGAASCTVARSDAAYDEQTSLAQWIDAKQGTPATQPDAGPSEQVASPLPGMTVSTAPLSTAAPGPAVLAAATEVKQFHTLRELLTRDLATRTNLSIDQLEMNFRAEDEKALNLSEPTFRFQIDPVRARDLGNVSWNVTILAGGEKHSMTINAEGRAWQKQLVLTRPLDSRQVIQPEDYIERRTLVDSLPNDPVLTRDQLVNEQASENLKPGTVMTARMVDAVPLVKAGQFVTITVSEGAVQIKAVATAMETGTYGQTIRVRNETTRDVYEVTMVGPQTATMNSSGGNSSGGNSSRGNAAVGNAAGGNAPLATPSPIAAAQ